MANKNTVTVNLGPPLFLLFLVFLVLKLTEVITWSWWWVTAPLWIPPAITIGLTGLVLALGIAVALIAAPIYFIVYLSKK